MSVYVVDDADAGLRVDVFVAKVAGIPRNAARRLCDEGAVRRGRARMTSGDRTVAGETITVAQSSWFAATPSEGLTVLAENDDMIVVDKPAGIPCHPLTPGEADSVAHRLVAMNKAFADASPDAREAGLLHRLDNGTSGCLAVAKNRDAWTRLRPRIDEADKRYVAVVVKADGLDTRRIDTPIEGKPARTAVEVLAVDGAVMLVRLTLEGGRRHQLRVHLASAGAPLVGDERYGGPTGGPTGARFWLHAVSLRLADQQAAAPIPADWHPAWAGLLGCNAR